MISEVKTNAVTRSLDRTINAVSTVNGASTSKNAPAYAVSAQKSSWVKVCVDELVQYLSLIGKFPYR